MTSHETSQREEVEAPEALTLKADHRERALTSRTRERKTRRIMKVVRKNCSRAVRMTNGRVVKGTTER